MAQCSDCYNGCSEISTDKCIKYTGVDVPELDIKKGDSLSFVEQALITFLTSTINGTGIQITIDSGDYCTLVTQYLQACETVTALDLFKALVKAACNLQTQVDDAVAATGTIEANYTVDCLSGVSAGDGTHAIVQAVITKLCEIDLALTALAADVDTNYVKLSDLNGLIASYIASTSTASRYYTRMIPYVAVEYYGPLTGFDASGAGIIGTEWEKIYLCNGDNGTPDHRGRVGVGATSTPGVIAMDSAVDPGVLGNPAYTVLDTAHGTNTIILDETQIPSHTHVLTDPGHTHDVSVTSSDSDAPNGILTNPVFDNATYASGTNPPGLLVDSTVTGITLSNTGGGLSHNNYQPGIGCYFIMYIP